MHNLATCEFCARRMRPDAFNVTVHKGIYYWRTYDLARAYAQGAGVRTDRIKLFCRGWAVQLEVSGAYVGPETFKGV